LAEEKVPPTSKEINKALRSYAAANKKSVSIDRIKNNNHIAVGLDKPVKVTIERGPAGDFLGALNAGANVILNGNAGRYVGSTMSSGEVRVNGDVGDGLGVYLSGGLVIVKGDCSGSVGSRMKGGVIIVDGNVKGDVGDSMVDGEIYVTGDVDGTIGGDLRGGRIFIAGKMPELHDNVKVKPIGARELEAIKDYHSRFRFRKFQTPEALNDFRLIERS
jgi:glutamate synthase domain-containing protein 3